MPCTYSFVICCLKSSLTSSTGTGISGTTEFGSAWHLTHLKWSVNAIEAEMMILAHCKLLDIMLLVDKCHLKTKRQYIFFADHSASHKKCITENASALAAGILKLNWA